MQQFIEKYRDQISGVLSGLDRLVFRSAPRRLNFGYFDKNLKAFVARGMEGILLAKQAAVQGLPEARQSRERTDKERVLATVPETGLAGRVCVISLAEQR